LATQPKLIVADEPTSALDVSVQAQILNLMKQLQKEFGLTYLFISHNIGVIRHFSDRVAVMYLGKVVEMAEKRALFQSPVHPYTQALLAAVPSLDPKKKRADVILEGDVPSPINPPSGCRFHTRCRYALPKCYEEEPFFHQLEDNRWVACHLYP
jgi:oligopeptide/dipeptide ABC transporter ATP-binding protein